MFKTSSSQALCSEFFKSQQLSKVTQYESPPGERAFVYVGEDESIRYMTSFEDLSENGDEKEVATLISSTGWVELLSL